MKYCINFRKLRKIIQIYNSSKLYSKIALLVLDCCLTRDLHQITVHVKLHKL